MEILVSGSLAYDRIMDFPGRFSDHIMPDKIHMINVSFTVNGLTEKFGGTAGNIAYALSLLGEKPRILATIGRDYQMYFQRLERLGNRHGRYTHYSGGTHCLRVHHHRRCKQPNHGIQSRRNETSFQR